MKVMCRAADIILLSAITLLLLGIVMVTSAGLTVEAAEPVTFRSILFSRPAMYAGLAVCVMFVASRLNVGACMRWRGFLNPAPWLFILSIACLCLVHINGLGWEAKGALRWVRIGPASWNLTFQPSEVAKWSMIFVLAAYASRHANRMHRFWTGLLPGLALVLITCVLIIREDLGTAVLICAVGLVMLLAAGARLWQMAILAPVPIAGVVFAIVTSEYRMNRIRAFLDPYADPGDRGYHIIQSMVAIANGRITGRGLGNGVQKFEYLPEDTTDFIFAVICEEVGIFGAVLVVALYLALIVAGVSILRHRKTAVERLICMGIVLTVAFQAAMNLMVVTGLAPTKGIALPLVSAGGTGWLLTAFALGILAGMDRPSRHGVENGLVELDEESDLDFEQVPSIGPSLAAGV